MAQLYDFFDWHDECSIAGDMIKHRQSGTRPEHTKNKQQTNE